MIFFVIMPALFSGFGNYFVPIYSDLPEIIFPRTNNFALFLIFSAFIILSSAMIIEYSIGVGWTLYPPLSVNATILINLMVLSILISGLSSLLSSINYIICVTETLKINLFSISIIITALMLLFSLPILSGALLMILSDFYFNTIFFILGDPILFLHLFWYFGHPEVYILILPSFGILSQIISSYSHKMIFGFQAMILAMIQISIFGSLVWGHHIYTIGLELESQIYYTFTSLIISLPTSTKIYNWLCISLGIRFLSLTFGIIFLIIFTLGGVTGIILGNDLIDLTLHDTFYVISHFHFILSIGAVFSILSALLFFTELFCWNRFYIFKLSRYYFLLLFLSINFLFFPLYFIGYNLLPRRFHDYPDFINSWDYLSSIGSLSTLIILSTLNA